VTIRDQNQRREGNAHLLGRNGLLAGLAKLLDGLLVVTQILLAADEDDGKALAEVKDFGNPLQTRRGTCQQNVQVRVWVAQAH